MEIGAFDDVYASPEKHGLRTIGEIEWDPEASYSFDLTVLWYHEETKTVYAGSDSGCSCPSPFESVYSLDGLKPIKSLKELLAFMSESAEGSSGSGRTGAVGELIMKVRPYL